MTLIAEDEFFTHHLTGYGHPESPFRFKVGKYSLQTQGLLKRENTLKPHFATDQELLLCHTRDYIDEVQRNMRACELSGLVDGSFQLSTGDVQICPESDRVARYAVGAVLEAVDAIMQGRSKNAFCLVRPPGHHACSDRGMGFCLYNNVALGARYVIQKYHLKRVLIVDWDVHHGNGTQEIFYEDPSVFYFSTHNGRIYPGTGWLEETGNGAGKGFNLNYPLDPSQNPRESIKEIFSSSLVERMEAYRPEFVFISAGFDAHEWDPLGGFNLTTQAFAELTLIVKKIAEKHAEGRLVSVLEGGYNLDALAEVIPAHVKILNSP
jgi:acetoin utilization deacetylase AcuC-like enzyme